MKKITEKPTKKITIPDKEEKQEPFEIIYADPRDEEIHLKFLNRAQISAHMARWFLDYEYNQLLWSDGIYEILEIDSRRHGASYDTFLSKIHPEDREKRESAQTELLGTKKPIELTYRILTKDGRIKWINEICNTDFDKSGNPIRLYGIIQDITKYKLSEEKFKQQEIKYKAMMDTLPMGVGIYQNKKIVFINPVGIRLLGAKNELEVLSYPVSKLVSAKSAGNFRQKMNNVEFGKIIQPFEVVLTRLDGSQFEAEIITNKINFEGNPAVQVVVNDITERKKKEKELSQDITERKKAEYALQQNEQQLKELIATKDKFFSIIAHDLRSPFVSIMGFLELLQTQYDDFSDDERKSFIDLISENADTTLNLLENLLVWAKMQTGRISFMPVRQKLLPIMNSVKDTLKSALKLKNIALTIRIPDELVIFADTNMLFTIFQNLVSNAIKYSSPESEVLIESKFVNNYVEIAVIDNGTGMEADTKSRLFKVEEQVSEPGTDNEKGSGLGLILCKDFIERHNGTISVESELGKGSRFSVKLPVA
jgi:PAS domain S-box-containing protein